MGGYRFGAGRPGWRVKAEHLLQLDARRLARDSVIGQDNSLQLGTWAWRRDGQQVGAVQYIAARDTFTVYAGDRSQVLPVLRTPCHYGGSRCWFGCPQCGQRVAIVYWRNGPGFGCRRCNKVAYGSQAVGWFERAMRRQAKIERRLGDGWSRPRGMHQSTYGKLITCLEENEQLAAAGLAKMVGLIDPKVVDVSPKSTKARQPPTDHN